VAAVLLLLLGDGDSEFVFSGDVRILSPQNNEVVTGPFVLRVESPTYAIADPAEGIPGAAHFAAFVDWRPFTQEGSVIPEDEEGVYHFASGSITLDLPPGSHRINVALGDNDNVRIPGATVAGVTVTVEPSASEPAAPTP
jgi:hypothetical protein